MRIPQNTTRRAQARGVALVTVLIVIVLITALIIGFLARAGSERVASSNYSASVSTNVLASTAINLVQSQINEATTTTAAGSTTSSLAWASQPGAIRLFDTAGNLKNIYRLYSSNAMTTTNVDDLKNNDIPNKSVWQTSPALWTDLNEPVAVMGLTDSTGKALTNGSTGYNVYPILDPRDPASTNPSTPSYLDAKTDEYGDNWGFSYDNTNVAGFADATPVMPVRWMYVLQNGQVVAPDAGATGRTITISSATPDNPIVGRIAFWTDDDTCKVNVNTAAGSRSSRTYYGADSSGTTKPLPASWNTPHYRIFDERLLFSEDQPVHDEYQRYPGHPATTDLFNIFNALGLIKADYPVSMSSTTSPEPGITATRTSFYKMLPRYDDANSSQGGSHNTTASVLTATKMTPRNDRLYTSLGEMLYDPTRTSSGLTRQQLESGKFFLTTHSRAPEVTLFGTPRIAMWPLDMSASKRTAFDQLLAFCATTGEVSGSTATTQFPYYFQRSLSTSTTNDYLNISRNVSLFDYLRAETSQVIPGFGGTFASKYSSTGTDGITTENDQILTEMVDYIRSTNMEDHSYSAQGLNVAKPYAFTNTTNGVGGQVMPLQITRGTANTQGLGRYNTLSEIGIHIICTADGGSSLTYADPVIVSSVSTTYPTSPVVGSSEDPAYVSNLPVTQFLRDHTNTVVGIGTGNATTAPFPANPTLADDYSTADPGSGKRLSSGQKRLQAVLLMECASPMVGYDPMSAAGSTTLPDFQIAVSKLENMSIGGKNPFPSRSSTSLFTTGTVAGSNGNGVLPVMMVRYNSFENYGGIIGFRYPMSYNTGVESTYNGWSGVTPNSPPSPLPYRFVSNPFTVNSAATMSFSGAFKIELQTNTGTTFQTFNVSFPTAQVPLPNLIQWGLNFGTVGSGGSSFTTTAHDWWSFDNRIGWLASNSTLNASTATPMMGKGCFVRSDLAPPPATSWNYLTTASSIAIPAFPAVDSSGAVLPSDVVRTLVAKDGDYRLTAAKAVINASGPNSDFDLGPGYTSSTTKLGSLFREQGQSLSTAGTDVGGQLVAGAPYTKQYAPKFPTALAAPATATDLAAKQSSYDWDASLPFVADGAHANKPDEGNDYTGSNSPYYVREQQVTGGSDLSSYLTANRIVSSPVMFGSLPTGVLENITWRTLLFRPQANRPTYANPAGPKDYLLLDLFNMPVVEPYAISEPFSTAGKINMNYQIEPFSYITRSTGIRAVLGSELIAQVPKTAATMYSNSYYKEEPGSVPQAGSPVLSQLPVNVSENGGTLQQFVERFNNTGTFGAGTKTIFKSAAEICDVHLVPRGGDSWPAFATDWYSNTGSYGLVGDNAREHPYADVYPRLTTKSNTYTVHYRVQALRSPHTTTDQAKTWDEKYTIAGEYRGSTTIERFIDPTKAGIPDYTNNTFGGSTPSLDTFYQWRVIANNRFAP